MDLPATKEEIQQSEETTAPSHSTTPGSSALQSNGTTGNSGTSPEPNSNGGIRQATRKGKSLQSKDDSGATCLTSSTLEQPRSLRATSSCSEKRSLTEGTDNEDSSSVKTGVAKRQSTRARTPRQTYQDQFQQRSEKGENGEGGIIEIEDGENNSTDHPSIDACAAMLAMLDERSYHRNLFRDASVLSRTILQPLSLPWMHKGAPIVRNMPFDLDDMTEILMVDDGFYSPHENGPLGFGRFDIGQLRLGPLNTRLATSADSWCSASRRSNDPGVLEMSSVFLPMHPRIPSIPEKMEPPIEQEEGQQTKSSSEYSTPTGEMALRCYQHAAKTKRRKIEEVRSCARRQLVSVKVNSTSSRSSIFTDLQMDRKARYGKLLEATLPSEVQSGRYLSTTKAQQVAEMLGTYDWRHGLSSTSTTGKNAKSISCGRTRLMWTEKSRSDMPQKVFFTSLLTGDRLEGTSQKRPRDIKVAIRVGGEIFGSESFSHSSPGDTSSNNFPPVPDPLELSAIYEHPRAECTLDVDNFVKNILNDNSKAVYHHAKTHSSSGWSHPLLDCLPDSNGIIGVVCSSPGKISLPSVHECLNHAAKEMDLRCCTVCWTPDLDQSSPVCECSECGVFAHLQCCYDRGETQTTANNDVVEQSTWKCAVCYYKDTHKPMSRSGDSLTSIEQTKKSKRRSRPPQWLQDSHIDDGLRAGKSEHRFREIRSHGVKCAVCPYHGGAMSPVKEGNDTVWIHEVCRIWMKGSLMPVQGKPTKADFYACALCGQGGQQSVSNSDEEEARPAPEYVVKCAASRCQVQFHPMCALLSRKLTELSEDAVGSDQRSKEDPVEASKKLDELRCACFTLTALDCEIPIGRRGKDPGTRTVLTLPVAFCGIHNPSREASFRGLYPAGKYITPDVMKIPALL